MMPSNPSSPSAPGDPFENSPQSYLGKAFIFSEGNTSYRLDRGLALSPLFLGRVALLDELLDVLELHTGSWERRDALKWH